jgi:hypothetical protein
MIRRGRADDSLQPSETDFLTRSGEVAGFAEPPACGQPERRVAFVAKEGSRLVAPVAPDHMGIAAGRIGCEERSGHSLFVSHQVIAPMNLACGYSHLIAIHDCSSFLLQELEPAHSDGTGHLPEPVLPAKRSACIPVAMNAHHARFSQASNAIAHQHNKKETPDDLVLSVF